MAYIEDVNHVSKSNAIDLDKEDSNEPLEVEMNKHLIKFLDISQNSKDTDRKEKDMTLKEGLKHFLKQLCGLSFTLIRNLINSLYTVPEFAEQICGLAQNIGCLRNDIRSKYGCLCW